MKRSYPEKFNPLKDSFRTVLPNQMGVCTCPMVPAYSPNGHTFITVRYVISTGKEQLYICRMKRVFGLCVTLQALGKEMIIVFILLRLKRLFSRDWTVNEPSSKAMPVKEEEVRIDQMLELASSRVGLQLQKSEGFLSHPPNSFFIQAPGCRPRFQTGPQVSPNAVNFLLGTQNLLPSSGSRTVYLAQRLVTCQSEFGVRYHHLLWSINVFLPK